jgi:hypothetical protein
MFHVGKVILPIASLSILLGVFAFATADTKTATPKGEYAQIDTRLANETIQTLAKGTPGDKQKTIENIKAKPENYAPPVFYVLSNVLFQDGQKDEGAFWFYAGQLRARFDANRCADSSARQAVGVLNQNYGSLINQYTFQDISKLELLIPKVVEWDRKTPHSYDHRWINLHGMGAMMSSLGTKNDSDKTQTALSLPKEQWDAIAEKTRADYLSSFKEAMAQMKSKNH